MGKLLICFFLLFYLKGASGQVLDIVFDLDWTLVYPIESTVNVDLAKTLIIEGKYYRITDWTSEVLGQLSRKKDIRISFYSGGNKVRNEELLKQIKISENKSAYDIAYKILSFDDLVAINDNDHLPISERFRKDLRKVNEDLSRIILVDDNYNFSLPDQKQNHLWLGKTYSFYENAQDIPEAKNFYDPPDLKSWKGERNKMLSVHDAIERVYEKRDTKEPLRFLPKELPSPSLPCQLLF